jgi:hypothetical protein
MHGLGDALLVRSAIVAATHGFDSLRNSSARLFVDVLGKLFSLHSDLDRLATAKTNLAGLISQITAQGGDHIDRFGIKPLISVSSFKKYRHFFLPYS